MGSKKKAEPKKVGRPSDYKSEYCQRLIEFFDKPPYEEKTKTIATKSGPVEINYEAPTDFPTISSFAISIGVSRDTLYEWTKKHQEFSDTFKRAKDFQERYLTINGLKGLIQGNFGIFTAKNVIDWRDKSEIESSGEITQKYDPQDLKLIAEHVSKYKEFEKLEKK